MSLLPSYRIESMVDSDLEVGIAMERRNREDKKTHMIMLAVGGNPLRNV